MPATCSPKNRYLSESLHNIPMHLEVTYSMFAPQLWDVVNILDRKIRVMEDTVARSESILRVFEDYEEGRGATRMYGRMFGLQLRFYEHQIMALSGGNIDKLAEFIAFELRKHIRGLF